MEASGGIQHVGGGIARREAAQERNRQEVAALEQGEHTVPVVAARLIVHLPADQVSSALHAE